MSEDKEKKQPEAPPETTAEQQEQKEEKPAELTDKELEKAAGGRPFRFF